MTKDETRNDPTVSIGLPVYNGGAYVGAAIQSILDQTFQDFELIICDNASEDNTEEICRSYAEKDARVRYHRQPSNRGGSANYGATFAMSTGKYFKWHGHDDLLAPTYVERLVEALEADAGCLLAYPRSVFIDENDNETWCFLDYFASNSDRPDERLETWLGPARDDFTNPHFGLYRREALARTKLMAPHLASDRTLLAHIALMGRSRMVPECLFYRRIHERMSTAANTGRDLRAWFDGKRPLMSFKQWRLLREYVHLINSVQMGAGARLRCYLLMGKWMRTRAVRLTAELLPVMYVNGHLTPLGRRVRDALKPIVHLSRSA